MTTTEDQEQPLPGMKSAGRKATRNLPATIPRAPVATTPQGQNAGEIIATWVQWYQDGTGVPIPQTIIGRMAKQVHGLVKTGYTTDQIKFALAIWTVQKQENHLLSPAQLDSICWQFALDTSARAQRWKAAAKAQIAEFSAQAGVRNQAAPTPTKREQRKERNLTALQNWSKSHE